MEITVFTDGSSRGNPGPGGWGAIIWKKNGKGLIEELGGAALDTTNNKMEISAAIGALESLKGSKAAVEVFTDSQYLINGITKWVFGWQKNGWITTGKKSVENRDLWERLHEASKDLDIKWSYVEGHAGHPGNERCDEIATSFADGEPYRLYKGPYDLYGIDLSIKPEKILKKSGSKSSSAKAYSYLSLISGELMIHKTWADCEARVKGKSGAKFKKSISKEDEARIIEEWGV